MSSPIQQSARPNGNCYARKKLLQGPSPALPPVCPTDSDWHRSCRKAPNQRSHMGPAIALRLRQHLTLTPQVQQALRLLQMSALEFQQEMDEALSSNPFLEENPDAPPPAPRDEAPYEVPYTPEASHSAPSDRDQEEWSGIGEAPQTLQEHLREQLLISPMGERDRALAHMVIDSLDDDGYFKLPLEELAALVPPEYDVRPEELSAALHLVQSLDPTGVGT